ncbi:hypothetical protein FRC10_012257 [Ceratobasidium sp. 414]|nr:hypothetical protein FRC10_012257 [Ceratobasidium sp. 414]
MLPQRPGQARILPSQRPTTEYMEGDALNLLLASASHVLFNAIRNTKGGEDLRSITLGRTETAGALDLGRANVRANSEGVMVDVMRGLGDGFTALGVQQKLGNCAREREVGKSPSSKSTARSDWLLDTRVKRLGHPAGTATVLPEDRLASSPPNLKLAGISSNTLI